jgi:hypothetical protein
MKEVHRTLHQLFLNLTQRYKDPVYRMYHEMSINLQLVIYSFILKENFLSKVSWNMSRGVDMF